MPFSLLYLSVAMERWSVQQRIVCVRSYYKTNSVIKVQRLYRRQFNIGRHGHVPSRNIILAWVRKFEENGSVLDVKHGAPRTVRTPENVETVREAFERSPRRSARQQSRILGISRKSLFRILKEIRFHPYKLQVVQKINERDKEVRLAFCTTMNGLLQDNPDTLNNLLMSDEAHFYLSGSVNKQNMRYWSPVNPMELHEKALHSPKVTVWCGVGAFGIVGPYFFENNNGQTVTVNSQRYVNMLEGFVAPQLRQLGIDPTNLYFQHDGATAHTAGISMAAVQRMFGSVISRFGDIAWPARSPDLSVLDFFLWGYLKDRVFKRRIVNIQELKQAIVEEVAAIDADLRRRVFGSFQKRLQQCIDVNGSHLPDVIFKK